MTTIVDFETEAINFGSGRAPKPVGVSIRKAGGDAHYWSFGHPTNNNCTEAAARSHLEEVWNDKVVFHHGKFDIAVAMEHWDLPWPKDWEDTLYLLYLTNPHAPTFSLKPSAERVLGLPPEEQDAVREWLVRNGVVPSNSKDWGAHICKAPGDLVGVYANGDTLRAEMLFDNLYDVVVSRRMVEAYEREKTLAPILYEAEFRGVRIDREKLARDLVLYEGMLEQVDQAIRAQLGSDDLDIDTPSQLAKALTNAGYRLRLTPKGRVSTSQDAFMEAIKDNQDLLDLLSYRGACKTVVQTFMRSWLAFSARDGRLHPNWNQTKNERYGTKTGRLSCSNPNLQNVPTEFEFNYEGILRGFAPIPFMRQYILPDEGEILVAADYNGQEMRLLAHFAEGKAAEIYRSDPRADFHAVAVELVSAVSGMLLKRKQAKITGFSLIYGAGVPALAEQLGVPGHEASKIKKAYLKAIPGLKSFQDYVSSLSEVRTYGGRYIPVEPPKHNEDGSTWTFEYKLVNHLIQGSAADQTKESTIRYHRDTRRKGKFLLTVHDETVTTVKLADMIEDVQVLVNAMESLPNLDVPFVVEVECGYNWHDMKPLQFERLAA